MRSENNVLSYLATVAVRAAIKFAADPGSVEIGIATKVSLLQSAFELKG